MKNIHVLPTDKPSNYVTNYMEKEMQWHNIYITNDEKIQRDWFISLNDDESFMEIIKNNEVVDFSEYADEDWVKNCQKIVLTTDPDLIKDGVQAIDDDFLEWFVNNPSCEEVEVVEKQHFKADKSKRKNPLNGVYYSYKTIIPKEEPNYNMKQEILAEMERLEEKPKQETLTYSDALKKEERLFNSTMIFKQETLEEAAEKRVPTSSNIWDLTATRRNDFIAGAKWQAEKMYSLDEILKSFDNLGFKQISSEELNSLPYQPWITDEDGDIWVIDKEKWFQSFKKKV